MAIAKKLLLFFLVAFRTTHGLFDVHGLMTSHALLMVGAQQSGGVFALHKRFVVTALAPGRFDRFGAVVMAALTQCQLTGVEVFGQFVVGDIVEQGLNDFSMGKIDRFILVGQRLESQFFGNVRQQCFGKRSLHGLPGIEDRPGDEGFLIGGRRNGR